MSDTELVVVQKFSSRPEADLAKSALEAAGIDAMVRSDDGGGMKPALSWADMRVEVIVRAEDASAAREVLENKARKA
ncbi:MAG: DUF2007 domain-containing protein [Acidobacteria bacterium]|nr:DUF2007 domain-containing protein [Acidobacteriota bacterium]